MPKKTSNFSREDLKALRDALPKNWEELLAEKHRLTSGTVKNILYGSHVNDDIVMSAIELAQNHKTFIETQREAIKALKADSAL